MSDLAAARRQRKSRDDGRCTGCGNYRAVCSRYGSECVFRERHADR